MSYIRILNKCLSHAKSKRITKTRVGAKAGITYQTIINWQKGVSCPSVVDFIAVINACGFQVSFNVTNGMEAVEL